MPPAFVTAATTSFVWQKATIGYSQPYSSQSRVRSASSFIAHIRSLQGCRSVRFAGYGAARMLYQ